MMGLGRNHLSSFVFRDAQFGVVSFMRIAILNTLYYPYKVGGAEVSVQLLAEDLVRQGEEVFVISTGENSSVERFEHNGVTVYRLPLRNIYWPFSGKRRNIFLRGLWILIDSYNFVAARDVFRILREISPDVVHTNNLSGFSVAVWGRIADLGIPIVHTSRDYYLIHPNAKLYKKGRAQSVKDFSVRFWSLIKKKMSFSVAAHVSISSHVRDIFQQAGFFSSALQYVIYNSVEAPDSSNIAFSDKGISKFGYIGRIEPEKGVEVLLRAFNNSPSGTSLIVGGDGDSVYLEYLRRIDTTGRVHFVGRVQPKDFFPKVDCLVVPSLWDEPLGRVVLEAYSYGIPVIASRSGGLPDIVKPGETGRLYERYSIYELGTCISEMANVSKALYYHSCLEYSENFSSGKVSKRYLECYEEVCDGHDI